MHPACKVLINVVLLLWYYETTSPRFIVHFLDCTDVTRSQVHSGREKERERDNYITITADVILSFLLVFATRRSEEPFLPAAKSAPMTGKVHDEEIEKH